MELLNACSHHGYLLWKLAYYFYEGLTLHLKQLLESVCNGEYMKKKCGEKTMDYINYICG